jgi:polyferredoxin
LTLELAGHRFRIEELYLVWLFVLCLIFLFILVALILGRVWCGWACPQTALIDLGGWAEHEKSPATLQLSGLPVHQPVARDDLCLVLHPPA